MLNILIFLWLGTQPFYRRIWQELLQHLHQAENTSWLDVGCNAGHLCRFAHKNGFCVTGIDIDKQALKVARVLSPQEIKYTHQLENNETFDIITAHSLLSVVADKEQMLQELLNYKNESAKLIIIEPTEKLSVSNVFKLIHSPSSFWYYKGLLLWAFFRQEKAINEELLADAQHIYMYHEMIRISLI